MICISRSELISCRVIIGFAAVIIIFGTGCKDKCESHEDVSQESKDYGYFLQGSYWVYQNDSTQQIDSFNVISATTGTEVHSLVEEGCNPHYYYAGFAKSILTSALSHDSIEYLCRSTDIEFYNNAAFEGIYFTSDAYGRNDDSIWESIVQLDLNGQSYYNVYESKYYQGVNIYFAKNIGVIKTEISDDSMNYVESWSLLRHHVIQ